MKNIIKIFLFSCFTGILFSFSQIRKTYDVKSFGAKEDSITINTKAIQKAIDKCSKKGGGTVIIDNGIFISGTILLKDNVTLLIKENAKLVGSSNAKRNETKNY